MITIRRATPRVEFVLVLLLVLVLEKP